MRGSAVALQHSSFRGDGEETSNFCPCNLIKIPFWFKSPVFVKLLIFRLIHGVAAKLSEYLISKQRYEQKTLNGKHYLNSYTFLKRV